MIAQFKICLRTILTIICLLLPYEVCPAANDSFENKSSEELFGRASSYIEADTLLDKAVAALSTIANRYYAKPDDSIARRNAITAMYELGNIYSLRLFDYPKAYTNLSTARMIAEEDGDNYNLAFILLRIANIYNICYDALDQQPTHKIITEALDRAIKGHNEEALTRIAIDLSILQLQKKGWGPHASKISRIQKYGFQRNSKSKMICMNVINGMNAYFQTDYENAERYFKTILANLPANNSYNERYEYAIMHLLKNVYERSGNYDAEERLLRSKLAEVKNLGLDDYILYTYGHLARLFEKRNMPDSVEKYNYLFLLTKEKLEENSGLDKVKSVDLLRMIEKANDDVRELSIKRMRERRHLIVAISIIVVAIILLLTFAYLFFNLKRNHRLLFQKNSELLDREKQLRLLMSHTAAESSEQQAKPDNVNNEDVSHDVDEECTLLFPLILKVMEEDRSIYNPGFGIDNLAALLHVSPRSVSKAINACSGSNYHQFLNGYRIREACRMMQTTDPASTTVEYIAETVGFKSRTSFASLFKKTTGLTPSEYWKMAWEKAKNNNPNTL